jgi:hypothetical protein
MSRLRVFWATQACTIPIRVRAPSPYIHLKASDACVAGAGFPGGCRPWYVNIKIDVSSSDKKDTALNPFSPFNLVNTPPHHLPKT